MESRRPGRRAEQRALRWYRLRGYRILAVNAWAAGYELDLVVRRGRRLVFCEVKEKRGVGYGDPVEMVDEEKQRRSASCRVVARRARRMRGTGDFVRRDLRIRGSPAAVRPGFLTAASNRRGWP